MFARFLRFLQPPTEVIDTSNRDIAALTAHLAEPALRLSATDMATRSWVAADPYLPADVDWPHNAAGPLQFVARLSLAELHEALPIDWLPTQGALLFFHDPDGGWGHAATEVDDFRVLLVPDMPAPLRQRTRGKRGRELLTNLQPQQFLSLVDLEHPEIDGYEFDDLETDAYGEYLAGLRGGAPMHQVAGHPEHLQGGNMQIHCDDIMHPSNAGSVRSDADVASAVERWKLLLQLDSDDAMGLEWTGGGRLYFWVEASCARAGDFSRCWRVLQCG